LGSSKEHSWIDWKKGKRKASKESGEGERKVAGGNWGRLSNGTYILKKTVETGWKFKMGKR